MASEIDALSALIRSYAKAADMSDVELMGQIAEGIGLVGGPVAREFLIGQLEYVGGPELKGKLARALGLATHR